ncbi:thiamine pyrophosphate-dependent enzyme [Natronomonas marina]|jgi:pyruvate dehydrogenase E1 component alpha subunit|uniref:thiamine pyrophosphate-dependent enzyme n=1 Tax=Natronomonas marina TaxID=2961939 RepID=UPI0020C9ECBC|nr:thiamine pyrophosphate-dependent enzyme [Natronomonas marina]
MHRVIGERDPERADDELARTLLREMVRARLFDERAFALQRQGWMSGYPPFRGQEASQVGAATALADDDWLVPTYRSNAAQLTRGVPMADILRFRRGYPEFGSGHDVPVLPQAVPIASQIPHATGLGMAANYRESDEAVLCCFGDGATSEGDFHEGLNFAGVFEAPVVFFCENNGWAISTPETRQTASETIAAKAEAYGIDGYRVDGNDPLAVHEAVDRALADARAGAPVLLESLTYRQGPHTTSDDPDRYDDRATFPEWRTRDPIERFVEYLEAGGVVEAGFVEAVREAAAEDFEAAREAAEAAEPDPDDVFEYVYEEPTPALRRQRAALEEHLRRHGDPYE